MCLGLIHAKEIADILLLDRLEQKEREEYYETPKFHGVSTNDIRFMEANQLSTYTLVIMYMATAIAGIYALCTLGLLIGTHVSTQHLHRFFHCFHSIITYHLPRYDEASLWANATVAGIPFDCVHFKWNGSAGDVLASQSILRQCHWRWLHSL